MSTKTDNMPLYETIFMVHQDMSSSAVQELGDLYSKIIESKGGRIIKREYWGLRKLAYKINKNSQAHYFFLGIEASIDAIKEIKKKIALTDEIFRYLVIKVKHLDTEPTPMVKKTIEE